MTDLIGNKTVITFFNNLIKNDNFNHAYLFYGLDGIGKKTLALKIAEKLLGTLNSPDIKVIQKGSEQILVSDIRDLKNFLSLTSFGKYKIVILDNTHNLNKESSNALLKFLEEPSGRTIIFLITHLPKLLLPTITSRCQAIRFKPVSKKEIHNFLTAKGFKEETAYVAAELSNGSVAKALNLADNLDEFNKNSQFFTKIIKNDLYYRFNVSKKLLKDKDILKRTVQDWILYSYLEFSKDPEKERNESILRNLLNLNYIINQQHFNHKLALDNFLIQL